MKFCHLHVFEKVLCALHEHNPFERRVFAHDSTAAIGSYDKLTKSNLILQLVGQVQLKQQPILSNVLTNLHGFVVPTVAAILGNAPAVQHQHGPRAVADLGSPGVIETDQTQATLDHVQGVSVSRL